MKQIVVTGSHGFIGTRLREKLEDLCTRHNAAASMHCFDKKIGKSILHHPIPEADVIFHLAAQTSVQDSWRIPMQDAEDNIMSTIKLLTENPNAKIIVAASAAAKDPKSPYGISKLAEELYAQVIHKNVVICRLPNVFDENDNGVVGKFLKACKNKKDIIVYGGEQTRDFVHVDDIVRGLIQAADWEPGVYELGSGVSHSIEELAAATYRPCIKKPRFDGEILHSECKNTTPNWHPKIDVIKYIETLGGMRLDPKGAE